MRNPENTATITHRLARGHLESALHRRSLPDFCQRAANRLLHCDCEVINDKRGLRAAIFLADQFDLDSLSDEAGNVKLALLILADIQVGKGFERCCVS